MISKGKPWKYDKGYFTEEFFRSIGIKGYADENGGFANTSGPATIEFFGSKEMIFEYRKSNENKPGSSLLHKINGPAEIHYGSDFIILGEKYYLNGEQLTFQQYFERAKNLNLDNEYLPKGVKTMEVGNFSISFSDEDGMLHCDDGPAWIYEDGDTRYYKHGVLHRLDGPARVFGDIKQFFIESKNYTEEEYYNQKVVIEYFQNKLNNNKDVDEKMTSIVKEFTRSKEDEYKEGFNYKRFSSSEFNCYFPNQKNTYARLFFGKDGFQHNSNGPSETASSEGINENNKCVFVRYCIKNNNHKINGPAISKFIIDKNREIDYNYFDYWINGWDLEFKQYYEKLENHDFNNEILPKGVHRVVVSRDTIDADYRKNNIKFFNKEGQLHCEDGPAIIFNDGINHYYQNDNFHRLDGPAICRPTFDKSFDRYYINGREFQKSEYFKQPEVIEYINKIYFEKEEPKMSEKPASKPSVLDNLKNDAKEAAYSSGADTAVKLTQLALSRGLQATGNDNALILSMLMQHPSTHSIMKMVMGIGLTMAPKISDNEHAQKIAEKMRRNAMAEGMGYVADEVISMVEGLANVISEVPSEPSKVRVHPALSEAKKESIFEDEKQSNGNQAKVAR